MKFTKFALGLLLGAGGMAGCADECPRGDSCSKTCDPGFSGLCVAEGLCECAPTGGGVGDGGMGGFGGGAGGAGGVGGGAGGAEPPECAPATPGSLIINEIMPDPAGSDSAGTEYVELINATDQAVSLRGLSFHTNNSSGAEKPAGKIVGGCLAPRGVVAIFDSTENWIWSPEPLGGFEATLSAFSLVNSSPSFFFAIRDANNVEIAGAVFSQENIEEGVSANRSPDLDGQVFARHDEVFPGRASSPGRCANGGTFANGCQDAVELDMGVVDPDAGVPPDAAPDPDDGVLPPDVGDEPDPDMMLQPDVPALPGPMPGEVIITEIMFNAGELSDSDAEWVELFSVADGPRGLAGCTVKDRNDSGSVMLSGSIEPGAYMLLAASDDMATNGGLVVDAVFGFGLNNGGDTVFLICDGIETDSVDFGGADWPGDDGQALQLNPASYDGAANDDPFNWCGASDVYFDEGTPLFGTPGAPNVECAAQ